MKLVELIKKYKIYILSFLVLIFFFRSCGKSRTVIKLEKNQKTNTELIDSLEQTIVVKQSEIDAFPEVLRKEKLAIHLMYNDTISKLDRTPQTMWLQKNITLPSIKQLQK